MKTICIFHSIDLDGWMSAAIVKHWYIEHVKVGKFTSLDSLEFIGYNYGQPIPDLSEYDKVIMCDISFPRVEMHEVVSNPDKEFIWIDHHVSAITENIAFDKQCYEEKCKGIRDTKFAACELTWKYFFPNNPMPEIVRLLGMYDSFRHKNTEEEQKVLEFQYGARQAITNYEEAYNYLLYSFQDNKWQIDNIQKQGKAIYQYLCTEAKQVYKNGFPIVFDGDTQDNKIGVLLTLKDGSTEVHWKKLKFICINKERFNPINFGIDYHADGYDGAACFHYANGQWNFSLYNDNGKVDCSMICKTLGGGGHKGAAGFRIKDIYQIIK